MNVDLVVRLIAVFLASLVFAAGIVLFVCAICLAIAIVTVGIHGFLLHPVAGAIAGIVGIVCCVVLEAWRNEP